MPRYTWNNGSNFQTVQKLRNVISQLQGSREQLMELFNELSAYGGVGNQMATDLGTGEGASPWTNTTAINNLITQAYGELCSPAGVTTQVSVGNLTALQQLINNLG